MLLLLQVKDTATRMLTNFSVQAGTNDFYSAQRLFKDPGVKALPQVCLLPCQLVTCTRPAASACCQAAFQHTLACMEVVKCSNVSCPNPAMPCFTLPCHAMLIVPGLPRSAVPRPALLPAGC